MFRTAHAHTTQGYMLLKPVASFFIKSCSSLSVVRCCSVMANTKVFFDMAAGGTPVGRIIMEVSACRDDDVV